MRREALKSLFARAERRNVGISRSVRADLELQAKSLFDYATNSSEAMQFAAHLKSIAVRLLRQRRYREANARFRLASRFNPGDPTLISNRATCMYNLAKYPKCIDMCLDCLAAFPKLGMENPKLYCKILIRMGRANIELDNFEEATSARDALTSMRKSLADNFGSEIPQEEFSALIDPFERHLKAKLSCSTKAHEAGASSSGGVSKVKDDRDPCGENGVSSDDDSEGGDRDGSDDDSEGEDGNLDGFVKIEDLCPHLHRHGNGPCDHQFSDRPTISSGSLSEGDDGQYSEPDLANSHPSGDDSMSSLASSERDESVATTDSNMPDLVSEEDGGSNSEDSDGDFDGPVPYDSSVKSSRNVQTADGRPRQTRKPRKPAEGSAKKRQCPAHPKATVEVSSELNSKRSVARAKGAAIASATALMLSPTNFQPWFVKPRTRTPPPAECLKSPFSPSVIAAHAKLPFKVPTLPPEIAARELRGKVSDECYESDDERGPRSAGLLPERRDEHRSILNQENNAKGNGSNHSMILRAMLKEVMGKSFRTNRSVDFTRIFGNHVAAAGSSKRKKKICDKRCASCFARKMWNLRFVSTDMDVAKGALNDIETDSRKERRTFLARDLWQGTGYYASGYEMAFDVPALVHGVAYLCHLQSEIYWRGDKVAFARDTQYKFISSLERIYRSFPNIDFLFMLFIMIRDTLNLFGLFPDPFHHGDKGRSFQFSKSASVVAQKSLSLKPGESENDLDICDTLLASRTEDVNRNLFNWSRLGHVTKEEEWIYHILLRDISHLMTRLMKPALNPPMYLEPGESFSDAFEKACGERSGNEKYWRCRIVTIVDRTRHRMIERTAHDISHAGNIAKGTHLISHAITGRPRQARLFLKRAQVRSEQAMWKESLRDIDKGIALCERGNIFVSEEWRCNPPEVCCKIELLTAQCDIFLQQAITKTNRGADYTELLKKAVVSLQEAMACKPVDKKKVGFLEERLDAVTFVIRETTDLAPSLILPPTLFGSHEAGSSANTPNIEGTKHTEVVSPVLEEELLVGSGNSMNTNRRKSSARRKKRKTKSAQKRATPEPPPTPANPENVSSSSDDDGGPALAGNPYAALLGEEHIPASVEPKAPTSAPTARSLLQREGGHNSSRQGGQRPSPSAAYTRVKQTSGGGSSSTPESSSRLDCVLCGLRFHTQSEFDSHMRGRRHRTAVAHSRAAGQTAAEWRSRVTTRSPPSPRVPVLQARQTATDTERRHTNRQATGPTREEALGEVERAVALLGGEARPCDIISRLRFSNWNIPDATTYLDRNFGGLLRLCLQGTNMFEIRAGTESRPVLAWIDPSERRSDRLEVNSNAGSAARLRGTSREIARASSVGRNSTQASSESSDLTKMLRDQLLVSNRKQRKGEASGEGEARSGEGAEADGGLGECGICLDNVPDIRLIPCGHQWCTPCIAENIINRRREECPVCKQVVQRTELLGEVD